MWNTSLNTSTHLFIIFWRDYWQKYRRSFGRHPTDVLLLFILFIFSGLPSREEALDDYADFAHHHCVMCMAKWVMRSRLSPSTRLWYMIFCLVRFCLSPPKKKKKNLGAYKVSNLTLWMCHIFVLFY